jgi:hypothetical protein
MESLIALLVVLVAPMTIAFVLSTLLGRSLIVVLGLLGIGVVLSPSVFFLAYLTADTGGPANCSDCYEFWGRWWLPRLAVLGSVLFLLFWIGGLVAGRAAVLRRQARSS